MGGLDGWLTLADAAARFGVLRSRLKQASSRGALATVRLGDYARCPLIVRPEEVERYLRETRMGRRPGKRPAAAVAPEEKGTN